jgi:hypothetical protein
LLLIKEKTLAHIFRKKLSSSCFTVVGALDSVLGHTLKMFALELLKKGSAQTWTSLSLVKNLFEPVFLV